MFHTSVDGVTVSIGAFQALVPGSTPGRRTFDNFLNTLHFLISDYNFGSFQAYYKYFISLYKNLILDLKLFSIIVMA